MSEKLSERIRERAYGYVDDQEGWLLIANEVESLMRRLAESAVREQSLMLQLGERDKSLVEADETIKGIEWGKFEAENESSMKNDRMAELKARLRAASELAKKWREQGNNRETTFLRRIAFKGCADELEVALGEEG